MADDRVATLLLSATATVAAGMAFAAGFSVMSAPPEKKEKKKKKKKKHLTHTSGRIFEEGEPPEPALASVIPEPEPQLDRLETGSSSGSDLQQHSVWKAPRNRTLGMEVVELWGVKTGTMTPEEAEQRLSLIHI